ncbi:hypothetical protein ABT288_36480 [Streptomyces sp. NPDC001093]|uniref:hypothetical protein n=1 Tax=Streptomyces sp. NPDC001093 TaxID=3154376 RepID=UPI003321B8B0
MEVATFMDALGGTAERSDFPSFMDDEAVEACLNAFLHVRAQLSDYDRLVGVSTEIELVRSPFFTCRTKEVGPHHYAIAIPLGLVCRVYVLAHLLCGYLHVKAPLLTCAGMDATWEDRWRLPAELESLFGAARADDNWWRDIAALYARVRGTDDADYDAKSLTSLAVMFIAGHEGAHVHRRHGAAFRHFKRAGVISDPLEEQVFKRFAETDADIMATYWVIDAQRIGVKAGLERGLDVSMPVGHFRLSYAVTMLYALYDAHRKRMGAYEGGIYSHPIVRRDMFTVASTKMAEAYPAEMRDWLSMEKAGFVHCVRSLNVLNFAALGGFFGKVATGYNAVPVSSLHYEPAMLDDWDKRCRRETVFYSLLANLYETSGEFRRGTTPEEVRFAYPDRETIETFLASGDSMWQAAWDMTTRVLGSRPETDLVQ